jgi:drug/metabolite transporter (DMT)-like permease
MAVNPAVAGVLAAVLLDEPITAALIVGLVVVVAGIWLATTESRAA